MLNLFLRNTFTASIMTASLCFSLLACHSYPVTLNGNALNPAPLFNEFSIDDKYLAACVKEHIFDHKISNALELRQLNCAQRSIHSLKGIEVFSHLLEINVGDNPIETLAPLFAIPSLEKVKVVSIPALCNEVIALRARGVHVSGECH